MGNVKFWHGTKAQYDATSPKNADTLYCTSDGGIFKGSARLTLPPAFGEYLDRNGQVLRITETYGTNPAKQIFSIARRNANESYFALSRVTTATGGATEGLDTAVLIESDSGRTSFMKSGLVVGGPATSLVSSTKLSVMGAVYCQGELISGKHNYVVCSTAASSQTKAVTLRGITALTEGQRLTIKFTYRVDNLDEFQINLNGLGAKGVRSDSHWRYYNDGSIPAGDVVDFVYDGSRWHMM